MDAESADRPPERRPLRLPGAHWRFVVPALAVALALGAHLYREHLLAADRAFAAALARQASAAGLAEAAAARVRLGEADAFHDLRRARTSAVAALAALTVDAEATDRWYSPAALEQAVSMLRAHWRRLRENADRILTLESRARRVRGDVEHFQSIATGILVTGDELVDAMVAADESAAQVRTASRQLVLIERIAANVRRVLEGGEGALTAADRFGRDAVLFGEVNNGLLNGNRRLGVTRVENAKARDLLVTIGRDFRAGADVIERVVDDAVTESTLTAAAAVVTRAANAVEADTAEVARARGERADARMLDPLILRALDAVALLALVLAGLYVAALTRSTRLSLRLERAEEARRAAEQDERIAALVEREGAAALAARRLVGEVERLSRGDLNAVSTAHRELSDTPLAPLEVAVGGVRRRLRSLSERVPALTGAGGALHGAWTRLRDHWQSQNQSAERAAAATRETARTVETLAARAHALESAVAESGESLDATLARVGEAVTRLEEAVAAVRATAGQVRALADNAMRVRELVRVVEDVGEQAKLLSLNVAIQSTVEGEAGRALARFGDEVQRLVEQTRRTVRRMQEIEDHSRIEADAAAAAVKRSLWAAEQAGAAGRRAAEVAPELAEALDRLRATQTGLAEACQSHTLEVTSLVRAMTDLHRGAQEAGPAWREASERLSDLGDRTRALETAAAGVGAAGEEAVIDMVSPPEIDGPEEGPALTVLDGGRDAAGGRGG